MEKEAFLKMNYLIIPNIDNELLRIFGKPFVKNNHLKSKIVYNNRNMI